MRVGARVSAHECQRTLPMAHSSHHTSHHTTLISSRPCRAAQPCCSANRVRRAAPAAGFVGLASNHARAEARSRLLLGCGSSHRRCAARRTHLRAVRHAIELTHYHRRLPVVGSRVGMAASYCYHHFVSSWMTHDKARHTGTERQRQDQQPSAVWVGDASARRPPTSAVVPIGQGIRTENRWKSYELESHAARGEGSAHDRVPDRAISGAAAAHVTHEDSLSSATTGTSRAKPDSRARSGESRGGVSGPGGRQAARAAGSKRTSSVRKPHG